MQEEAEITINGVKLTDAQSMTVRVAIDTLANVLAEGLGDSERIVTRNRSAGSRRCWKRASRADNDYPCARPLQYSYSI